MIDFFKLTLVSLGQNVRTLVGQLRGNGAEGVDDDAEPVDDVELLQPHGLCAWPTLTPTTEVAGVHIGDEVIGLGMVDKGKARLTIEQGETQVYSDGGAVIRLRANGDIEITAAPGQNVVLNGGMFKVARTTDATADGALTFAFSPGSGGATLSVAYTPPGGSTTTLPTGSGTINLAGQITGGAANVKA